MRDYYKNTREVFNRYNLVSEQIKNGIDCTSEDDDEFM